MALWYDMVQLKRLGGKSRWAEAILAPKMGELGKFGFEVS